MKLVVRECICLVSIPRELESLLHCVCPILTFRAVPICSTTDLSLVGGNTKGERKESSQKYELQPPHYLESE